MDVSVRLCAELLLEKICEKNKSAKFSSAEPPFEDERLVRVHAKCLPEGTSMTLVAVTAVKW